MRQKIGNKFRDIINGTIARSQAINTLAAIKDNIDIDNSRITQYMNGNESPSAVTAAKLVCELRHELTLEEKEALFKCSKEVQLVQKLYELIRTADSYSDEELQDQLNEIAPQKNGHWFSADFSRKG